MYLNFHGRWWYGILVKDAASSPQDLRVKVCTKQFKEQSSHFNSTWWVSDNPKIFYILWEIWQEFHVNLSTRWSRVLSRQCTECFILCIAQARPCFNCFKELTYERLVKAYPFQSITRPSTSSFQVRQLWRISYANTSVSRLILPELTWICHLVSFIYNRFSHLTVLYSNIALQMHF